MPARQYRVYPRQTGKTSILREMERYIHTQQALGNWPEVWDGDEVILALIDTYQAVSGMSRLTHI